MNKSFVIIAGLVLLALFMVFMTTYTVQFHEVAVKTRYGKATEQSVVDTAGLHFRLPFFIDRVHTYDTRVRLVETSVVETSTADVQSVVVRAYLMWRVDKDRALDFKNSYDRIEQADEQLKSSLQTAAKASIGRYRFDELVGTATRLAEAEDGILGELRGLRGRGIEPVSVGISQVLLPTKATTAVLERMEATRKQLAEAERRRGGAEAQGIVARANTLADVFNAFTELRVEDIRKDAAIEVERLLDQMAEEEDLAILLVQLAALDAITRTESTFIISDDASPMHLLNTSGLHDISGVPRAKERVADAPEPRKGDQEQGG